ncbi:MAG: hypothetical protein ABEI74_00315 [Candidatus Pacearchaeota archaeon]
MSSIKEKLEEVRSNLPVELKAPIERASKGLATFMASPEREKYFEDFSIFIDEGFYRGLYICTNPEKSNQTFSYENMANYGRPLGIISSFYEEFEKQYKKGQNFVSIEKPINEPIDIEESMNYFAKVFDEKIKNQKAYNQRKII